MGLMAAIDAWLRTEPEEPEGPRIRLDENQCEVFEEEPAEDEESAEEDSRPPSSSRQP